MLKKKHQRHNPVAMHMHINKGGAHGPTDKALRRKEKVDISKNLHKML